VEQLEAELERARSLTVSDLADAVESIGFECTQCGACCRGTPCGDEAGATDGGDGGQVEEHTATIFPDEVRQLQDRGEYDWRDVARPMPYGLSGEEQRGETFEWALQTDSCGDCTFYEGDVDGGVCTVYGDRPLICQTYPFSVDLGGTSQPMGAAVEEAGPVRAHECEGLGREISRADAEELAATLKRRAVRELEEAIAVRDGYEPADVDGNEVVIHDSEGAKHPDGTPR
jgi:Fe-S-cluster containining protein